MSDEKVAFEKDREVKVTKGLKISGTKSFLADKQKENALAAQRKEDFEQRADQFVQNQLSKQDQGMVIAKKFMTAMRDKTLARTKGSVALEYEQDLRKELQKFIVDLDNDEEEQNAGSGSASGIMLIVKTLFEMRDRINDLQYENHLLKKSISENKNTSESSKGG